MGGRERFYGPIRYDAEETAFHDSWEGRVHAMSLYLAGTVARNLDATRDAIERMDPADYLSAPYYGRWLASLEEVLVGRGYLAPGELDAHLEGATPAQRGRRKALPPVQRAIASHLVRKVMRPMPRWLLRLYPRALGYRRKAKKAPAFRVGGDIVVREDRPSGHTRLPGYVCGRRGVIRAVHGPMVFPDTNARREGEQPKHLYSVAFEAQHLWPDAELGVSVHVDLFEPYLQRAP